MCECFECNFFVSSSSISFASLRASFIEATRPFDEPHAFFVRTIRARAEELLNDDDDDDECFAFGHLFSYIFFTLYSEGLPDEKEEQNGRNARTNNAFGKRRIFPVVVVVVVSSSSSSSKMMTTTTTTISRVLVVPNRKQQQQKQYQLKATRDDGDDVPFGYTRLDVILIGGGDWFRVCSLLRSARVRRVRRTVGGERRAVDVRHVTHVVVGWELHSESF